MKEKNKFKLFTPRPIKKDDEFAEIPTNFKGYFVMLKRKFWNLSSLSVIYCLANFPIIFLLIGYSLQTPVSVVRSPMFSVAYGLSQASDASILATFLPFVGGFGSDAVPSRASFICFCIAALAIITFGLANAGAAYITRAYNRGDPVFIFSDFFGTIKKNWKQALVIGVVDIVLCVLLVYDFLFWYNTPGFINGIFMYFALFLCVVYFFMRYYLYTVMITFRLSVYKIFKDALMLAFLGLKRNFLALIGIILIVALNFQLLAWVPSIGIILPVILTVGILIFTSGYASYPVIKKYMIDPYYNDETTTEEPVFEDRG